MGLIGAFDALSCIRFVLLRLSTTLSVCLQPLYFSTHAKENNKVMLISERSERGVRMVGTGRRANRAKRKIETLWTSLEKISLIIIGFSIFLVSHSLPSFHERHS